MAKGSHKKQLALIGLSVTGLALIVLLFTGNDNIISIYRLRSEASAARASVERANRSIDSLKAEIESLKRDTAYIERIARERLGMAGRNEKIYKFLEEKK